MKRLLSLLICAVMLLAVLPQRVSATTLSDVNIRLDEPVASYTPDHSALISSSEVRHWTVTWKENSPGFDATLGSGDEFRAGLAYQVEIWMMVYSGDSFATDIYGGLAANITVNGKRPTKVEPVAWRDGLISEVKVTMEYGPLPGMEISRVLITGIPTPVEGQMPIYSFTLGSSNAYGFYPTEPVVWWDMTAGRQLDSSDTFIKGHKYQLNIWLSANRAGGYTFRTDSSGNPMVDVTLNSWAADSVTKAYEQEGREVIDIRYTFSPCQAAHTCSPQLVPQQDPTCVMPGFKAYYECSCGRCFEDAAGQREITDLDCYGIIPALGHREGDWSYNGTHHYKKCATCQEVIPGTNAAHSGGKATCVEKGKCAVCGYAYLPENEDHNPDTSKWIARIDMYHFHPCKDCGAHCDIEDHRWSPTFLYQDSNGHAWICADCKGKSEIYPHTPGPAATETTPQTCKDCGYIIEPAKGHQHVLLKVPGKPATCTQQGNIEYYSCTGCNARFKDAAGKQIIADTTSITLGALGHQTSDSWHMDKAFHWRACSVCAAALEETKMLHEDVDGKCATCGYVLGTQSTTPVTDPTPSETAPDIEAPPATQAAPPADTSGGQTSMPEQKHNDWTMALLIGLACFGAGITATVILLKRKKK